MNLSPDQLTTSLGLLRPQAWQTFFGDNPMCYSHLPNTMVLRGQSQPGLPQSLQPWVLHNMLLSRPVYLIIPSPGLAHTATFRQQKDLGVTGPFQPGPNTWAYQRRGAPDREAQLEISLAPVTQFSPPQVYLIRCVNHPTLSQGT